MNLHTETETAFCHTLKLSSDQESHNGKTMTVDGEMKSLFPAEARALAAILIKSADWAEGV